VKETGSDMFCVFQKTRRLFFFNKPCFMTFTWFCSFGVHLRITQRYLEL